MVAAIVRSWRIRRQPRGLWREEAVAAFKAEYELLSVENAQASFCESMLASGRAS